MFAKNSNISPHHPTRHQKLPVAVVLVGRHSQVLLALPSAAGSAPDRAASAFSAARRDSSALRSMQNRQRWTSRRRRHRARYFLASEQHMGRECTVLMTSGIGSVAAAVVLAAVVLEAAVELAFVVVVVAVVPVVAEVSVVAVCGDLKRELNKFVN